MGVLKSNRKVRKARKDDIEEIMDLAINNKMVRRTRIKELENDLINNTGNYNVITNNRGEITEFTRSYLNKAISVNKEKLKTRKEELDGIKYLVAPVVMVKQQVLNGELLPADEISRSAPGWNGRPVVVYHPVDKDGNDTIANSPDVIPDYEVGRVFNVEYDEESTKLKGEVWIDISRAKRKNSDTKLALEMIETSDELEVSTGYIVNDRVPMNGEFDGIEYIAVQRDILPDHLALLPNEIGACSFEDGAGVRNNTGGIKGFIKKLFNNLSGKSSINSLLYDKLKEEYDDLDYIADLVYDDETGRECAIFKTKDEWEDNRRVADGILYSIDYSFDPETNEVILGDNIQEVEPVQQYISKNNLREGTKLGEKEKLVRDVIANSKNKLSRRDERTLKALSTNALIKMLPKEKQKLYANKKRKTSVLSTNAGKAFVNRITKGKKFRTNEGEELIVEELIEQTPVEMQATVAEITDVAELEAIEGVLIEVIDAVEIIEVAGETIDTVTPNEEFTDVVTEVGDQAADALKVVQEAIIEMGESPADETMPGEDPATNEADLTDILEPSEEEETELVEALETASSRKSRRMRRNKRNRVRTNKGKTNSINEHLDSIKDPDVRNAIKGLVAQEKKRRSELITALKSSKSCAFSEKELKQMDTNQLDKLHAMASHGRSTARNTNYAAKGMQIATNNDETGFVPMTTNIFERGNK